MGSVLQRMAARGTRVVPGDTDYICLCSTNSCWDLFFCCSDSPVLKICCYWILSSPNINDHTITRSVQHIDITAIGMLEILRQCWWVCTYIKDWLGLSSSVQSARLKWRGLWVRAVSKASLSDKQNKTSGLRNSGIERRDGPGGNSPLKRKWKSCRTIV